MNGLGKPVRKKSDPKVRHESEIAACEQKPLARKQFFSNTVFSLFFKIRVKKLYAAKPLAFSLHFLFRRDQNHYSNLNSKIIKMCEQIFKKRQRPNNSNSLNCKNDDVPNNSRYRFAAIKKRNVLPKTILNKGIKKSIQSLQSFSMVPLLSLRTKDVDRPN